MSATTAQETEGFVRIKYQRTAAVAAGGRQRWHQAKLCVHGQTAF